MERTVTEGALAAQVSEWVSAVTFDDLPPDVVATTKLRILDVLGLSLAGLSTPFGQSTRAATCAMSPQGPSRIWGTGDPVGIGSAAFANASFAQALEYDDTHNESIVHMSSPAVAMGLANICVPHAELDATVQQWAEEICERSPTAIAIAKRSFNMDTAHQAGIAGMGMYALKLYSDPEESREGVAALQEKRKPAFRKFAT
jgi:hypothetical protein